MALGVIHPDILDNLLSSKQLAEWEIYYSLEPFGEEADWLRTATLANLYRNSKTPKGHKKSNIMDFMPQYLFEEKKKQNTTDMRTVLKQFCAKGQRNG